VFRPSVIRPLTLVAAFLAAALAAPVGAASAPPRAEPTACDTPAGDPDPQQDPDAWRARDAQNSACGRQRDEDQRANPLFQSKRDAAAQAMYLEALQDQASDPTRPRATAPYLLPVNYYPGDPFRLPDEWVAAGRGQMRKVSFVASSGAKLQGRLWAPRTVKGPLPAVVFTTGSLQGFADAYNAFYQGLAEEGYLVLSYDVQGQGRSESGAHSADGLPSCCRGVPFQQDENFFQGTRDALTFMFSTPVRPYAKDVAAADGANGEGTDAFNPWWSWFDGDVGIAGHSYGAYAVSLVGQEDRRVKAVVGYDTLRPVPAGGPALHAPALSITSEDFNGQQDPANPPDPETNGSLAGGGVPRAAFDQLRQAGVDVGLLTLRSSQHNESSYGGSSQASRYGERVSFAYTLAWFDHYVKGERHALDRITAMSFDGAADRSSIGAGTYDAARNANVPYRIAGDCVANRMSIYLRSSLWVDGGKRDIPDLRRRGC
jgi:dienelactone hydrolase